MDKARDLFVRSTIMMEGITYLVLIPLAVYVVFYHGDLLGDRLQYSAIGLVVALIVTFSHGLYIRYFELYKPVKSFYSDDSLDDPQLSEIKLKLLKYPLKEAYGASFRWAYGVGIVILITNIYVPLGITTYIAAIAALFQSVLVNFINNYFIAERLLSDTLEEPMLVETIIEPNQYKEFSLINKTVITVVGIFLAVYSVISYLIFAVINETIPTNQVQLHFIIITVGLVALLLLTIKMFNYSNKKSLIKIKESITNISEGELTTNLSMTSIDELGRVCTDLNKLKRSLRKIAGVIFYETKNIHDHSESLSFQNQNEFSESLIQQLKDDNFNNLFEVTDALHQMTKVLNEMMNVNTRQNYIRGGRVQLSSAIQNAQNLSHSTDEMIKNLASHVDAIVGVLYVLEEDNILRQVGSYGHHYSDRNIMAGEGLIGQVALDRQMKIIEEIPENNIIVDTGIVQLKPNQMTIIPCVYNDETKAVVVLGTMGTFEENHIEFLESASESVALAITSHQANEMKEALLDQSQKLTEELREQQEELMETNTEMEQMNEELEQQTEELKKSEARLESQQQELRNVNEELKERSLDVEKQRDELNQKNEKLRKTRKQLEEKAENLEKANQYKSEFLANMSHELRTPLNSIIILSKVMYDNEKSVLTEKEVEYSETIYAAAHDLLELINEILDLSKVEAGMMEVNLEYIHLRHFTDDIKMAFKELAITKGLDFSVEIDTELPEQIQTDPQKLKQIIKNLLSNAFKFTNEGSVIIKIYRATSSGCIAFSVSDSGIGIPKDKQQLIFKEFSQADGNTNRKYGGTGLGLSISEKFAKFLGGEIQLASKEKEGSTFTLLIPDKNELEEKEVPKPIIVEEKKASSQEVEKDKLLLIIDDDPNSVKVIKDFAGDRGFKCLSSLEGEQGLEMAKNFKPDAIILDIKLPGIDGFEVMKRLNDDEKTSNIPVHFVSSLDEMQKARDMGALGFTTKPITGQKFEKLFAGINGSLKGNVVAGEETQLLVIHDDGKGIDFINQIKKVDFPYIKAVNFVEANNILDHQSVSSIVINFSLKDKETLDFLRKVRGNPDTASIPIILYSDEMITEDDEVIVNKYVNSIIIESDRSEKRLINELALFLHHIEDQSFKENQAQEKYSSKGKLLSNKKVLIVDDDMRNIFALSSVLEDQDMKVVVAKNGKEGMKRLNENDDIDLILMDIMMPEMDGYETMREVRKIAKYKNLPIIALTAKAMKGDKQKCLEAGANDYMSKPVDIEQLLSLTKVWLQR
ncbi:response regulator [Salipaludibacillus sp. HK11]|uniref:response regulator n=1 Tax=Salipaludibacillus sp. HK11 TaxID=3394320 RepID=UPI0039FD5E5F